MEHLTINGEQYYNMVMNAANKLEENKDYVNALNVFPVPDGDTGTNMSMTFKAAATELQSKKGATVGELSKILARGALMGARGNSGVILSQILRGMAKGFENKASVTTADFAESLTEGAKAAYKAVMRPTEGTILTIIRCAGEIAVQCEEKDMVKFLDKVCKETAIVLDKTPDMLPVNKQAGVVDAGGMGLLIILKGMHEALRDKLEVSEIKHVVEKENVSGIKNLGHQEITFAYCTEFIIISEKGDANAFKHEIGVLGDSMVVVSDEDIVKVHIHTNDPGLVLSKAVKLGELSKIKIENMREQHTNILNEEAIEKVAEVAEAKKYAFISVAMGNGIKNIFEDLGVDHVIEGGQTMNPSTQDILECINNLNAENIFVLPNNKNIIMAATQAAQLSEKNIIVIPSKTIPQGISAVTMFNADGEVEENVEAMKDAISSVTSGQITYAVRDTELEGKTIKEGNILGIIEGKIAEVAEDPYKMCEKLLEDMINEDSELVTVLYGSDCDKELVDELVEKLEEKYEDIDIQCYDGEQPLYYFILAVE